MIPKPLFLARVALRLLLTRDERASVLSDLAELYERRCLREGTPAADAWLARQWKQ